MQEVVTEGQQLNVVVTIRKLVLAAKELIGTPQDAGENREYERAMYELITYAAGLPTGSRDVAHYLGIEHPHGEANIGQNPEAQEVPQGSAYDRHQRRVQASPWSTPSEQDDHNPGGEWGPTEEEGPNPGETRVQWARRTRSRQEEEQIDRLRARIQAESPSLETNDERQLRHLQDRVRFNPQAQEEEGPNPGETHNQWMRRTRERQQNEQVENLRNLHAHVQAEGPPRVQEDGPSQEAQTGSALGGSSGRDSDASDGDEQEARHPTQPYSEAWVDELQNPGGGRVISPGG